MTNLEAISIDPTAFILEVIDPKSIVVINLDRRPERWQSLLEAWPADVAARFERFSATDGRTLAAEHIDAYGNARNISAERAAGEMGCRESYVRAVREHGPALYFEDDARPSEPWSYGMPPDDAELVLLGGELWSRTDQPGWTAVDRGVNGTHAIWIRTHRAADVLLHAWQSTTNWSHPIDYSWRAALRACGTVVAVPQIVRQADLESDVQIGRQGWARPVLSEPWCSLRGGER